ncbi:hypothetical protein QR77_03585 [Streptomyces sp. 150FB]|nr:hypothetical protein QR77_03585 [Streptomyces sp. 150FB]
MPAPPSSDVPLPGLQLPGARPGGPAPDAEPRLVKCGMCGRPLTGAASRRSGLGPACDAKLHPPAPDIRTRRREAEQDTIPGL